MLLISRVSILKIEERERNELTRSLKFDVADLTFILIRCEI